MPFARNNLECVVGSTNIDRIWSRTELDSLVFQWKKLSWLDSRGRSTGEQIIVDGFSHLRMETGYGLQIYSNHQGGYRVMCPQCGHNITGDFSAAVTKWRGGNERIVRCGLCGQCSELETVVMRPPGMFADGVLILCGVESIHVTDQARHSLYEALGEHQIIFRRLA